MIVVSDTSPIINLAAIGELPLLHQLYSQVTIPRAVYHEIAVVGAGGPGSTEVQTLAWIQTRDVVNRALVTLLQMEVDDGEAEALALALELTADLLLLDERRGRGLASRLGLQFVGLVGVLVEAKHRGIIPAVKPLLDALMASAGFWVSQQLYAHVLQAVGE